jgi:uncharacterized membrane protein YcaP (DUF421 family)
MFFDSWTGIVRVVVVGILAYLFLILWLRLSGKRTLAKWNAFDFVVTVALGSTLATVLLSNQVALVEGVIGLGLLIGLQFVITWLSVRSVAVRRVVKSEPTLLLYRGEYMHDAMKQQRVTDSEVRNAIRSRGIGAVEDVEAVILETDGNFSVIRRIEGDSYSALIDVSLPDRPARTPR